MGGEAGGITGIEFLSASLQGIAAVLIEINFSLTGFNESLKTSYQLSTGTPFISTSLWYVAILDSEALSQYQPGKLSLDQIITITPCWVTVNNLLKRNED